MTHVFRALQASALLLATLSAQAADKRYHCDMTRGVLSEKANQLAGGVDLTLKAGGFEVYSAYTRQRNVVTGMIPTKPGASTYRKEEANGDLVLLSTSRGSPYVSILTKDDDKTPWLLIITSCRLKQ